jgi:hypothetical protein
VHFPESIFPSFMKTKVERFRAWIICTATLGISSSFSLADPTFSDDNWISMGGIPGTSWIVRAAVEDGAGNLYIGGIFNVVGDVVANCVAKWNGSSWSALLTLPALSLVRSGTDVTVSWPSADTAGFALEQTGVIASPASWVTNSVGVADDGTNKSVTVSATNSAQFFRLRNP